MTVVRRLSAKISAKGVAKTKSKLNSAQRSVKSLRRTVRRGLPDLDIGGIAGIKAKLFTVGQQIDRLDRKLESLGGVGLTGLVGTITSLGLSATAAYGPIVALGTALTIAAAPVSVLAVGLGGIALAFGAIIGSGILAWGKGFSKAMKNAWKQIKPLIKAFGQKFVPLLKDAVRALPQLVKSILQAIGPLTQFKNALRDLGRFAAMALPKLIGWFIDIGRLTLPIFRSLAGFIIQNVVPALRRFFQFGKRLLRVITNLNPSLKRVSSFAQTVWKWITKVWKAFRQGVNQGQSFWQQLIDLKNALINLWTQMQPTLKSLMDLARELAKTAGLVAGLALDIITLAIKLRSRLAPVLNAIVEGLVFLVDKINKAIIIVRNFARQVARGASRMNKAWKKVSKIAKETRQTFNTIKRLIRNALNYVWRNIIQPITQNIEKLWRMHGKEIKQSINQLLTFILDTFRWLKKTATRLWNRFGDEIMAVVDFFSQYVVTAVTQFTDLILTTFDVFTDILAGDWNSAWKKIKGFLDRTVSRLKSLIKGFVDMVKKVFDDMIATVIRWFNGFKRDAIQAFKETVQGVADWFSRLPGMLGDLVGDFVQAGENIIQGVIRGIKNFLSDIPQMLKNAAQEGADAFIDAFNSVIPNSIQIPKVTIGVGVPGPDYTFGGGSIDLPSLDTGGFIEKAGVAFLHAGERVIPSAQVDRSLPTPNGGGLMHDVDLTDNTYNIDLHVPENTQPEVTARTVADELRSRNLN